MRDETQCCSSKLISDSCCTKLSCKRSRPQCGNHDSRNYKPEQDRNVDITDSANRLAEEITLHLAEGNLPVVDRTNDKRNQQGHDS